MGEYIAKHLPLAIFAMMTGVEEVGFRGARRSAAQLMAVVAHYGGETCIHTTAEAAHI